MGVTHRESTAYKTDSSSPPGKTEPQLHPGGGSGPAQGAAPTGGGGRCPCPSASPKELPGKAELLVKGAHPVPLLPPGSAGLGGTGPHPQLSGTRGRCVSSSSRRRSGTKLAEGRGRPEGTVHGQGWAAPHAPRREGISLRSLGTRKRGSTRRPRPPCDSPTGQHRSPDTRKALLQLNHLVSLEK
uniref:Uncharacterized protein n=1 Tax=Molossus molossus TaxID=27622 RepID=A0A7J8B7Q5_MOLMO|nr:hypothetical protein HJG59_010483 [Molossus molossus]